MEAWDSVAAVLGGGKTGERVRLRGWVHRQRTAGKMAFIVLRDGTGTVQCTVKAGVADAASLEAAKGASLESSVEVLEGAVVADPRAPGGFEVAVDRFALHQRALDFPLRGEQGTEFELDNRHLWLRSSQLSAVLRVKGRLYMAVREFFAAETFVEVDPSVITTNACEGGSTLFTFTYFGQTAYLSQSAQMYLEGCIFGLPKVFSITPSFRAEKSRTSKHLTEFHHLEAEAAWWDSEDNRKFQERLVTHLAHAVARDCQPDLAILGQDPQRLAAITVPFPRLDYGEAVRLLQEKGFPIRFGDDFGVPHEKALTEGRPTPIFVCDWPASIKAFYMAPKAGTDRVLCSDLLAPDGYGEIIGGSQRSEDIAGMEERLLAQTLQELVEEEPPLQALPRDVLATPGADTSKWEPLWGQLVAAVGRRQVVGAPKDVAAVRKALLAPYQWYFDLRRYGSVPHSGFGLGLERLLRWFTGQEHIRDMLPYPRTPSRAYP
ncbi:MAG: asparagine--tRNA ligase [Thermoplasmatota archaeon]